MKFHKLISPLLFTAAVIAAVSFLLSAASTAYANNHLSPNPGGEAGVTLPREPTNRLPGEPTVTLPTQVSNYLDNLYIWSLGLIGIAALFAFVRGGVTYMFSGASPTLVGEAKKQIWNGIFGLLIAAGSYLLLNTINPDLVTHGFNLENIIRGAQQGSPAPTVPRGPAGGGGEG